ncbi:MAG: response regulator [Spirulinaceae cyanobacterium RM2_2_10]|nr:response regulator [Spirulinaceae cyanobacterium RM2_2_10]
MERDNRAIAPLAYWLHFAVTDTGPGIAAAELELLFRAFAQTESGRNAAHGTGLGLSISQQFVRLMGGEISVQSEVGQGSTFAFSVRARLGEVVASSHSARCPVAIAPNQPNYRILVVDDAAASRDLVAELLTATGFQVKITADGAAALQVWQHWQPHLIWLDLQMPGLDGYDVAYQIRQQETLHGTRNPTQIVALTASVFEEERSRALTSGFDDFIRKPFQTVELFDCMARHLQVEYVYTSPEAAPRSPATIEQAVLQASWQQMPAAWREQVCQASVRCNSEALRPLLAELPPSATPLAIALRDWLDNFRFDRILQLEQSSEPQSR